MVSHSGGSESGRTLIDDIRIPFDIPVVLSTNCPIHAVLENPVAFAGCELVSLSLLDASPGPVRRWCYPLLRPEEDWSRNHDTTDQEVARPRRALVSKSNDTVDHGFEVWSSIHFSEALPRLPCGERLEALKAPKTRNCPQRSSKLEEERLIGSERTESAVTMRLPEVDLVQLRLSLQMGVPVGISQPDVSSVGAQGWSNAQAFPPRFMMRMREPAYPAPLAGRELQVARRLTPPPPASLRPPSPPTPAPSQ